MICYPLSIIARLTLHKTWGAVARELKTAYRDYCLLVKPHLSEKIINTLIAGEDHRFHRHGGVDIVSVIRALWKFISKGKIEGGSTIEQQLIRTITGNYKRHVNRKIKEMLLATLVKQIIPKSDVPGVYLSLAYFGWGMNGIMQACRKVRVKPNMLTSLQAAQLVARLKYPEPASPSFARTRQINRRAQYILRLIEKHSFNKTSQARTVTDI